MLGGMNRTSKFFIQATILIIGVLAASGTASDASGLELDKSCRSVESVFARGSKQNIGDKDYRGFKAQLEIGLVEIE